MKRYRVTVELNLQNIQWNTPEGVARLFNDFLGDDVMLIPDDEFTVKVEDITPVDIVADPAGWIITKLEELFSVGAHLSDVHPDVRGIPMRQYRMAKITERCSELLRTHTPETKAAYRWRNKRYCRICTNKYSAESRRQRKLIG